MKNTPLNIFYAGVISDVRLLHKVLDAITDLNITLEIAGVFDSEEYYTKIRLHPAHGKVKFYGFVSYDKVRQLIKKSDFCIIPLKNIENYRKALPVKLFEYMLDGAYIVAQDFEPIANIINKHKCGLCINFEDVNEIKEAFLYCSENIDEIKRNGARGSRAVKDEYNWKFEAKKLNNFYEKNYQILLKREQSVNNQVKFLGPLKNSLLSISKNRHIQHIYIAAAFSILISIARDYYLINYVIDNKYYFQIIYTCALFSGFAINSLSLSKNLSQLKNVLFLSLLSAISILISKYFAKVDLLFNPVDTSLIIAIVTLWIFGAMFSRNSLDSNLNFFISRIREPISSLALIFFIFLGFSLNFSLLASVAFGTFFSFLYLTLNNKSYTRNLNFSIQKILKVDSDFFILVFYANVSVFIMNLWAINFIKNDFHLLGYSNVAISRFSMYIFQALTLGAIYYSVAPVLNSSSANLFLILGVFLILISSFFISNIDFLIVPLGLACIHFYCVHKINSRNFHYVKKT